MEEWVTDGKPHLVEKLPVGEELILREITAPEGYEIAEDYSEVINAPLYSLLGVSAAGLMATMLYKKRHKKADEAKKEE